MSNENCRAGDSCLSFSPRSLRNLSDIGGLLLPRSPLRKLLKSQSLKGVVRWLDSFGAHIDFALRSMMRGVHEHVHDHRPSIRIRTTFP